MASYKVAPIGAVYGRLTVLGSATTAIRCRWRLRCACGVEVVRDAISVVRGTTSSCGCLQRERAGATPTHGLSSSPTYRAYHSMRSRCTNPKQRGWKDYGGRGITVCRRWLDSFEAFLTDMGEKPTPSHSLGRIDNEGNYEPGNVEWQTPTKQRANRRDTKRSK